MGGEVITILARRKGKRRKKKKGACKKDFREKL